MRRRPGISGLQRGQIAKAQYKAVGDQATEVRLDQMRAQMAVFKRSLEEFATKHRNDIRKNPDFRSQFHKMCANCGVDPLQSNKGMFAELLGFGDFYSELGVQILEACLATKELNGGLMDMSALLKYIRRRRGCGSVEISEDDVVRAADKLKVLGGGFTMTKVGNKRMVCSVPMELNRDHNHILELAQAAGHISLNKLDAMGWSRERTDLAMKHLLDQGLALLDDGDPDNVRRYWFPCIDVEAM